MLGFFAEPIGNGFSRSIEHAADVYGLEVIHGMVPNSAKVAAHSFQVEGEVDLADPLVPSELPQAIQNAVYQPCGSQILMKPNYLRILM